MFQRLLVAFPVGVSHHDFYFLCFIARFCREKEISILVSLATTFLHILSLCDSFALQEEISLGNVQVEVLPAYNMQKEFHKKKNGWVGYKITKDETTYAILGDTDNIPELQTLSCDVLFIPIGGTYTMDPSEAAALANAIVPKLVVPTHYGTVVGTKQNEKEFLALLNKSIKHKILIKDAKK